MLDEPIARRSRGNVSVLVSFAAHCGAVLLVVWVFTPKFVQVSSATLGNRGEDFTPLYFPAHGFEAQSTTSLQSPHERMKRRKPRHTAARIPEPAAVAAAVEQPQAGSAFGTQTRAFNTGLEARPALPVVFPDPHISRSEVTAEGDVVVEITIDAQGNVVGTKLLQSLGSGIDNKVLAILRDWRFTPATVDGVSIPSRQDVYFHFPNS